jgi:hypothetical protein
MTFFGRLNIYYKAFISRIDNDICYPAHHVTIMSIFVFSFYSNLQTVTAIAVFCDNINASRIEKETVVEETWNVGCVRL